MFKKTLLTAALLSAFILKSQIPNYVPLSGLQGYWPFTGNSNDLSGNNYNGTVNGAVLTTDRFGSNNSAYSFNGTGNYISTNYPGILGNSARAVSFWAKTTETSAGMAAVCWGSNTQGNRFDCYFNYAGSGATFDSGYGAITYNSNNAFNNAWHHYVFQFNGTTINQVDVYKDAVLLTQTISTYNATNVLNTLTSFNVQFGRMVYVTPDYFKGQLDDIGIWNRKLTSCEIQQLYTSSLTNSISISGNNILCAGQTATLTASGGSNYVWSNSSSAGIVTVAPAASTAYSVTGTSNGCPAQGTVMVTVNPNPTITVSGPAFICRGQSATLTAMGANTYTWPPSINSASTVVAPIQTTTYTINGNSTAGCSGMASFVVSVEICTGTAAQIFFDQKFSLYPNPTNGIVTLEGIEIISGLATIYNSVGVLVYRSSIDFKTTTIDLSNLAKGVYILKIHAGNSVVTRKIIKD